GRTAKASSTPATAAGSRTPIATPEPAAQATAHGCAAEVSATPVPPAADRGTPAATTATAPPPPTPLAPPTPPPLARATSAPPPHRHGRRHLRPLPLARPQLSRQPWPRRR